MCVYFNIMIAMLRLSMLLGCIFVSRTSAMQQPEHRLFEQELNGSGPDDGTSSYSVTCYMCVNVSDNLICNQYAIDRPCTAGQTFCHTLHIMDSHGTSVLVNKKCASEEECQASKVGCVNIDTQLICVSCCDQNYCNVSVPSNSSNATFDDRNTKMRMEAKNLFKERDKALKAMINTANCLRSNKYFVLFCWLLLYFIKSC